ncbi:signal peptidase I [Paenibacillus sp. MBLB4367]|uniref:signal peptidase I n=1 Tax=Paenibacillus sp. MBLB4367 TaxID=3384767 RepID=UPI0039082F9E
MEEEQAVSPKNELKSEAWEWIKAILIAAGLVFLIRWFIFATYVVEGPSMQPNFHTGERLIVNKIIYTFRKPDRGEVVVFHAPQGKDYIKRVIALPGEKVKISNNKVYVNDQLLDEWYIKEEIEQREKNGEKYNKDFPETTVPDGAVFVMGDNRLNSQDSRAIGSIEYKEVVGRADVLFWPVGKMGFVKH